MLRRLFSTTPRVRDLNRIHLLGRVAGTPSTRVFQGNNAEEEAHGEEESGSDRPGVVQFTLATNRRYKNNKGELVELTDWHRVKRFGHGVVDGLAPRLEKGATVLVEGSLRYDSFTDKEGVERTVASIVAERVQVIKRPYTSTATEASEE